MKLVHAADLHLDSPLRGLVQYEGAPVDEVRMATRRAFAKLIDFCLAEDVRYLMIAGDLYDGDFKDFATALFFVEQVGRLRETGTQVVWLRGNHDAANKMTRHLRAAEHVHELSVERPESLVFEEHGVAFHGQGYAVRDVQEDLSRNYPPPLVGMVNFGLLHTALDGRVGHAPYAPCSLTALKNHGYEYWALGHVHQAEVLSQAPWVVFPGNLQGRHIKEVGPKGCMAIDIRDAVISDVVSMAFDEVRWESCVVDVKDAQTLDDVLESCATELATLRGAAGGRTLATRVRLVGQSRAHGWISQARFRIESELRAQALDFGDVYLEGVDFRTAGQLTKEQLLERHDALGDLFRAVEEALADPEERAALWEELARPLASISAELLRDESIDREEILAEAARLLEGRLLFGEEHS